MGEEGGGGGETIEAVSGLLNNTHLSCHCDKLASAIRELPEQSTALLLSVQARIWSCDNRHVVQHGPQFNQMRCNTVLL